MEKRKHSKFIIKNNESIDVYNVSYNPFDLYKFTLGVKKEYRFEKEFCFTTKKSKADIIVPYEADVDKVLLYEMKSLDNNIIKVEGIGIIKSKFEKIIGMSGNLKGQEVFFDDVCDKFRKLNDYIDGKQDSISLEEKIELVKQYLNIYTFEKDKEYSNTHEDVKKLVENYLGEPKEELCYEIDSAYEYLSALASENKIALTDLKEKGIKVLEKTL